ncbi:hypothetical protein [Paenibacillus sp. WLX2291]|uniref:hypothetical protein n=1 Tax=Paenibacillus sp. WLX2291 TaxID=3296934 RepID=UPI003983E098
MALINSLLSTAFNAIDKLDLNISEIEKIETKFRIARKVNIWIISPIFFITALVLSYSIASVLGTYYTKFFVLTLIIPFIGIFITINKESIRSNQKKSLYLSTFFLYIATIATLVVVIGYIFTFTTFSFKDFISWNGIIGIASIIVGIIICYIMCKTVIICLEGFTKLFSIDVIEKPILYITTSNNSNYKCELLNITKRGDYIIKPLESQYNFDHNKEIEVNLNNALKAAWEEILINRLHIVDIHYLGESENSKD